MVYYKLITTSHGLKSTEIEPHLKRSHLKRSQKIAIHLVQ